MVNVSSDWRHSHTSMRTQVPLPSNEGQDATTRTVMCPVCKALYTPTLAHQQLVLAPHIVLESAFMSMCHFCFRCRSAACPDCWDAVHGVCGACVAEAQLPFRTQVKPLSNITPPLPQQQQVGETIHTTSVLLCIQHGKFYVKPGKVDGRPRGAPPLHRPSPVPTISALPPRDRHSRDGGGAVGWWGPLWASVLPSREDGENAGQPGQIEWIAEALAALEQWVTGALLVLLLTIVTLIAIAEASPSANAQIMHIFQIDIRSEVAYLIHLIGQLQW